MYLQAFLGLFFCLVVMASGQDLTAVQKLENEIHKLNKAYQADRDPAVYKKIEELRKQADAEWAKERPDFEQQQKTTCGPACGKAAIKQLTGEDVKEETLAKEAGTDQKVTGTDPDQMVEVLQKHGLEAAARKVSVEKLAPLVGPGKPALAWVKIDGFNQHIVLIDDIWTADDGKTMLVRIRDPDGGKGRTETGEQFKEYFTGGVGLVSKPVAAKPKEEKAGGVKDKAGAYLSPEQLKDYGFAMNGHGLGEVSVNCAAPVTVELGTLCQPDDANYQVMMVVRDCPVSGTGNAEAVCIEFHKKVPSKAVRFQPGPCQDRRLLGLARFISQEPLGGPWDQGAVWIVTDHLGREEMNKRLVPSLSPWTYLRALRIAGEAGGVDYAQPDYRPCLDPSLLLDDKDNERDVKWLVNTFSRVDPGGLTQWLEANESALKALPAQHLGKLAGALKASSHDAFRAAGARLSPGP